MGREIKRVPLDFSWPLRATWKGFLNPYHSQECPACKGRGYTPEAEEISRTWYNHNCPTGVGGWGHKLTQDEVDALLAADRLMDFTHDFIPGKGWTRKDPPVRPTADEVNAWSFRAGIMGHDSINQSICVRRRCERLGIELLCKMCEGEGSIFPSQKVKELQENWYENERYEPPAGEAYQVWETVSEGSPISPPFMTPEELADWMVANDRSTTKNVDREKWIEFIRQEGSAPSFIADQKGFRDGVEAFNS